MKGHKKLKGDDVVFKKYIKRVSTLMLVTAMGAVFLSGCASDTDNKGNSGKTDEKGKITVGSKDFTESLILGELYAVALEDNGFKVDRKLNLASAIVHSALINKEVDLYPEYTGTGLLAVLKEKPLYDSKEVYDKVSKDYKEKFNVIWLDPATANDSQGLVITKEASEKYGIKTITDLQQKAKEIRFASQGEFDERADGLVGLEETYGKFEFKDSNIYDNGLKYEVLRNDKADVSVAYTTEGDLSSGEFVVLEDDKKAWPPYNIAPVVRGEVLENNPEIATILNEITTKLDNETVIKLNAKVDLDKIEYEEVAKEFYEKELK